MFLVIHKNENLKLVHVSTHNVKYKSAAKTSAYIKKAQWAKDNYKTKISAAAQFDDGFQVALLMSGMNTSDWTDTFVNCSDQYNLEREKILQKLSDEGYTNVGNTRGFAVRSLLTSDPSFKSSQWGKQDWNPTRKAFDKKFKSISDILAKRGYVIPKSLLTKIYFDLISTKPNTINTKADAINEVLNSINYED